MANHTPNEKLPPSPSTGGRASISLCMIIKDERHWLPRCLASVKGLVDEVVVIDTGSSDGSAELARQWGARVFELPWPEDFAAARNASVERARGSWILVLDPDETLAEGDHGRIREATARGDADGYLMVARNYTSDAGEVGWAPCTGEYPAQEQGMPGWFPSVKVRLFRNRRHIRFRGVVHELVEESIRRAGGSTESLAAVVHHYGYVREDRDHREKMDRYMALGLRQIEADPTDADAYHKVACLCLERGEAPRAEEMLQRALELAPENAELHFEMGNTQVQLGNLDDAARRYQRAIGLRAGYYEALNNLGDLFLKIGHAPQAVQCFRQSLEKAPTHQHAHLQFNLGRALEGLDAPQAEHHYHRALALRPNYPEVCNSLGLLCVRAQRLEQAREHFERALELAPGFALAHKNLGLACLARVAGPPTGTRALG